MVNSNSIINLFLIVLLCTFIISNDVSNLDSQEHDELDTDSNSELRTLTGTCGDVPSDFWAGSNALTAEDITLGGMFY